MVRQWIGKILKSNLKAQPVYAPATVIANVTI